MGQVIAGVVLLALVPVAWWQMLRGWRGRAARQADLAEPAAAPVDEDGEELALLDAVEGVYVSTVAARQPLERVVAHGLGTRSRVRVGVVAVPASAGGGGGPGGRSGGGGGELLVLQRPGARSFAVPAADLVGVRRTRGQAGKFTVEKEGLVVVTWRLGDDELDTGVRCAPRSGAQRLVDTVEALLAGAGAGPGSGPGGAA